MRLYLLPRVNQKQEDTMDREGPLTEDSSLERLREEVTSDDSFDSNAPSDRKGGNDDGVLGQLNDEDGKSAHPALN